ncbi:MAG: class I SAM-dependent methyltransferase [Phycisphaerae bacterium]|nr:class I SAM-dependent methyltransferase [Phycisphaerae bacterium]
MDRGFTTSIEIVRELAPLAGQAVVDVGCGDMTFTRQLAADGAVALGVDPDPIQAERNRVAGTPPNVEFIEADATRLPVADGSVDGVFFSFSLHHVPAETYPRVFAEVRRALAPDGYLCVIEPAGCPLNTVRKLFHDEDGERAAAQAALERFAVPAFRRCERFRYHSHVEFESFDDFVAMYAGKTFNEGYTEADIRRPEVRAAFERLGAPRYRFESPKTMMFLQGLRGEAAGDRAPSDR